MKRNNDIGGKAQLLLHVFCRQSEVFLHLSLCWWSRGELMKIGFTGITQLKRWGFKKDKVRGKNSNESRNVLQTISPA